MAIQMRRGNLADYDPDKMLPGELGVATDEDELYISFGSGNSKKVLTESDIQEVDSSLDAYSENPVQNKVLKSALDAKAPKASPAFTGTPTVPNAAAGTNTQQIANTKFVQDAVASKAPIASPTFTGTPKAPTAPVSTNNTQIATTAFVQALVLASAKSLIATDKGSGVVELSLTQGGEAS